MPRAATTQDPFNAIAEPKRRRVLEALADGEQPVNALVGRLGWPQPVVSKHLGVLREVGLVSVRKAGRQRLYRLEGARLRPLHDWLTRLERMWQARFDRLDDYLQMLQDEKGIHDKPQDETR